MSFDYQPSTRKTVDALTKLLSLTLLFYSVFLLKACFYCGSKFPELGAYVHLERSCKIMPRIE